MAYGGSQARGRIGAVAAKPTLGPQQRRIRAASVTNTAATAMWGPSHICNLHHSSRQHWILNPLSKARDRTHVLVETSWILFLFYFFRLFAISWAAPVAYGDGDSQARGRIRAVATGLHQSHSNLGSEPHLQPTPQLMATQDP